MHRGISWTFKVYLPKERDSLNFICKDTMTFSGTNLNCILKTNTIVAILIGHNYSQHMYDKRTCNNHFTSHSPLHVAGRQWLTTAQRSNYFLFKAKTCQSPQGITAKMATRLNRRNACPRSINACVALCGGIPPSFHQHLRSMNVSITLQVHRGRACLAKW